MSKTFVQTRDEALALIQQGMNPIMVASVEAPFGYKKDGTPADKRGRKPLAENIKVARELKRATSGRAKPGPVVKTPDAPFGLKKDGTPAKKRGRPSKEAKMTQAPSPPAKTEVALVAPSSASNEQVQVAMSPVVDLTEPEVTILFEEEGKENPPVLVVDRNDVQVIVEPDFQPGTKVRLVDKVCSGESTLVKKGVIVKLSETQAFIDWNDGQADWRSLETLEAYRNKNQAA